MSLFQRRRTPVFRGWIGFDARCPFCCQLVRQWRTVYERRGFQFLPLGDPLWRGLSGGRASAVGVSDGLEIQVWSRDRRWVTGPAAGCYLARQVGWLWPLGWLGDLPGIRRWTAGLYRWVAANRFCLGELCLRERGALHRHRGARTFLEFP